jgi:hypothetical protein
MFHDYSCDIFLFDTFQISKIKVIEFSAIFFFENSLKIKKKRISIMEIARGLIYLSQWHNIPLVSQPFCINPYLHKYSSWTWWGKKNWLYPATHKQTNTYLIFETEMPRWICGLDNHMTHMICCQDVAEDSDLANISLFTTTCPLNTF